MNFNFTTTGSEPIGILAFIMKWSEVNWIVLLGVTILTAGVHIVFAIAVYRDATRLGRSLALGIGPVIWSIATLIGGVITAGIYWTIHHSRLNPVVSANTTDNGTP